MKNRNNEFTATLLACVIRWPFLEAQISKPAV
jgi:hypothetical protein